MQDEWAHGLKERLTDLLTILHNDKLEDWQTYLKREWMPDLPYRLAFSEIEWSTELRTNGRTARRKKVQTQELSGWSSNLRLHLEMQSHVFKGKERIVRSSRLFASDVFYSSGKSFISSLRKRFGNHWFFYWTKKMISMSRLSFEKWIIKRMRMK